jgi:hypothetical protein
MLRLIVAPGFEASTDSSTLSAASAGAAVVTAIRIKLKRRVQKKNKALRTENTHDRSKVRFELECCTDEEVWLCLGAVGRDSQTNVVVIVVLPRDQ